MYYILNNITLFKWVPTALRRIKYNKAKNVLTLASYLANRRHMTLHNQLIRVRMHIMFSISLVQTQLPASFSLLAQEVYRLLILIRS